VLATVQRMKRVKEAAAYLKELGFDLSELENPADSAEKSLMVPVDTNYLFVEAA
jgi:rhodanese-related sulfurtransferase